MANIIFGSGIVGLMAKKILVGDWDIVPFARSRFYSFNPPLADNFITRDADIDDAVRDLAGAIQQINFYKRAYSVGGQLVKEFNKSVCNDLLIKIFGNDDLAIPGQSIPYLEKRMAVSVYDIRINQLYEKLQNEYLQMLKIEAAKGQITEIGKHYFIRGGIRTDFDNAISTIPLNALYKLIRVEFDLMLKNEQVVFVKSQKIDLEGCNQVFVSDKAIDFYKVTNVAKNHYMFYFLVDIPTPGAYLLPIIGAADVIDGTQVGEAMPIGQIPNLDWLNDYGIFCVGSLAQHDWCADVGSNILRLIRYAQRGYKP